MSADHAKNRRHPRDAVVVRSRSGGRTTSRQERFGAIVGMRVLTIIRQNGTASAPAIAERLGLEGGYVRRILRAAVEEGLLVKTRQPQRGTCAVQLYGCAVLDDDDTG